MPGHLQRTIAVLLVMVLLLANAPAGAAGGVEDLSVLVGGYELFGRLAEAPSAASRVQARLVGPGSLVRATASVSTTLEGGFELAFITTGLAARRPVIIVGGDRIALTAGGVTRELDVPALAATASSETQTVSGHAPPTATVLVTASTPDGSFASRRVDVDALGHFEASFSPALILAPGSRGDVLLSADGVTWQTQWAIPAVQAAIGARFLSVETQPGALVSAQVAARPEPGTAATHDPVPAWDGDATVWLAGEPLRAGSTVSLTLTGSPTTAWPLPDCTMNVAAEEGTVRGRCEPGRRLELAVPGGNRSASAGPDGRWSVALPEALLTPGTPVTLTFPEARYTQLVGYEPRVRELDAHEAIVTGQGTAGEPVALVVHRHGHVLGQARGWVGPSGTFRLAARDEFGQMLPRAEGDTWHVSYGTLGLALPMEAVTAAADGGRRTVWGTAAPGARVVVRAAGTEAAVTAGTDGAWRTEVGPEDGLLPGERVEVLAGPVGGAVTRLEFPVFRANVQASSARVQVEGHAGLVAEVELDRDGDRLASGHCTVVSTACETVLRDSGGLVVALQPGDAIHVLPSDGAVAVLDVVPMTAHIDLGGNDVVGQAPAGATVRIRFGHEPGLDTPLDAVAGTDETGVYDYELSATEWPALTPGLWADVYLPQANGHQLFARAVLEVVRVTPGMAEVRGLAEPGSTVQVTLMGADGRIGRGTAMAGEDGRFVAVPSNGNTPLPVTPGASIEVAHPRGTRRFVVEPFAAWHLDSSGSLAVLGAPHHPVRAAFRVAPGVEAPVPIQTGWTDAAGTLVLPPPPLAAADWTGTAVTLVLPSGDEVVTMARPFAAAGRVAFPRLVLDRD